MLGMHEHDTKSLRQRRSNRHDSGAQLPRPSPGPDAYFPSDSGANVKEWIEIWDYAGGLSFRGFVGEKDGQKALFVFFDGSVIGKDLKQGLMSLLELSGGDDFGCSKLVVCVDRHADEEDMKTLTRDLGWVGFELVTLDYWSNSTACTSDKWLFLEMDV